MSLINFWLAVYYPFLETRDPDTDPTLELLLESTPSCIFACYFSAIYTWHFPIFMLGWGLIIKNSRFLLFYIRRFIRSF